MQIYSKKEQRIQQVAKALRNNLKKRKIFFKTIKERKKVKK